MLLLRDLKYFQAEATYDILIRPLKMYVACEGFDVAQAGTANVASTFPPSCIAGTVMLATESLPFINKYMELEPLVNETFKTSVLTALIYDFVGCYLLYVADRANWALADRLCKRKG
jgi:hypothetical protein